MKKLFSENKSIKIHEIQITLIEIISLKLYLFNLNKYEAFTVSHYINIIYMTISHLRKLSRMLIKTAVQIVLLFLFSFLSTRTNTCL